MTVIAGTVVTIVMIVIRSHHSNDSMDGRSCNNSSHNSNSKYNGRNSNNTNHNRNGDRNEVNWN